MVHVEFMENIGFNNYHNYGMDNMNVQNYTLSVWFMMIVSLHFVNDANKDVPSDLIKDILKMM